MGMTGYRFDKDRLFARLRQLPGLLLWSAVVLTIVLPFYAPSALAALTLMCLLQNISVMMFAAMNTLRGFSRIAAAMSHPPVHPRYAGTETAPAVALPQRLPQADSGNAASSASAGAAAPATGAALEIPTSTLLAGGDAGVTASQHLSRTPSPTSALQLQPVDVLHLISIVRCTEPVDVLEETLDGLASHNNREAYIVLLALEARDPAAGAVGEALTRKYGAMFRRVLYAVHPGGIDGEVPGKSANTAWAVKTSAPILEREMGAAALDRMVVTVCDIDAQVPQHYFNALSAKFAAAVRESRDVFFAPPMLFNEEAADAAATASGRHIDVSARFSTVMGAKAGAAGAILRSNSGRMVVRAVTGGAIPAPVKIADQMWSMFVLQNLASGNWVKMPCSTYSVGLRLIASVGFWDVGVESVPEDYHTALKIFWGTGGRARLEPIYHPVMYQHIDGGSWLGGVHQRFLQGIRHMWGATDVAYILWLAIRMPNVPLADRFQILITVCDVHLSAAVITFMGSFAFPVLLAMRPDWAMSNDGLVAIGLQRYLTGMLLLCSLATAMAYEWYVADMVAVCTGRTSPMAEVEGGMASTPRKGSWVADRHWGIGPGLAAVADESMTLMSFLARLSAWLWLPLVAVLYLLAPASYAQTKLIFTDRLKPHVSPKSSPVASVVAAAAAAAAAAASGSDASSSIVVVVAPGSASPSGGISNSGSSGAADRAALHPIQAGFQPGTGGATTVAAAAAGRGSPRYVGPPQLPTSTSTETFNYNISSMLADASSSLPQPLPSAGSTSAWGSAASASTGAEPAGQNGGQQLTSRSAGDEGHAGSGAEGTLLNSASPLSYPRRKSQREADGAAVERIAAPSSLTQPMHGGVAARHGGGGRDGAAPRGGALVRMSIGQASELHQARDRDA